MYIIMHLECTLSCTFHVHVVCTLYVYYYVPSMYMSYMYISTLNVHYHVH